MEKTWKPVVAGILSLGAGGLSLTGISLVLIGFIIVLAFADVVFPFNLPLLIVFVIAIPGIVIEALAIVGGVFAIQRRRWGWALTGSIAAIIISTPLGIAAIIFSALSKDEFE